MQIHLNQSLHPPLQSRYKRNAEGMMMFAAQYQPLGLI